MRGVALLIGNFLTYLENFRMNFFSNLESDYFAMPKFVCNFAVQTAFTEAPVWGKEWRDVDIIKRLLDA